MNMFGHQGRDAHGCSSDRGYFWCAEVGKCLPPGSMCEANMFDNQHRDAHGCSLDNGYFWCAEVGKCLPSGTMCEGYVGASKTGVSDRSEVNWHSDRGDVHWHPNALAHHLGAENWHTFQNVVVIALAIIGVLSILHLGHQYASALRFKYATIPEPAEV